MYHVDQSPGRRAFTIGHEFGHYVLHRQIIEDDATYDGGIYCDENAVVRRNGSGIEQEADEFAAALLMPLHDFRRQLPAKDRPNFDILSRVAKRYGVSLTAAILRWLEYTETRAIMVVSNESFAHWAKPSKAALKSGRYIRTKNTVFELPKQAFAARGDYSDAAIIGTMQPADVWFPEPVFEMCFRSDRYDQEITVLQFEADAPRFQAEEEVTDVFDQFIGTGQPPVR
jgi:Zn-dependent peptidase ImmA (M78 family)